MGLLTVLSHKYRGRLHPRCNRVTIIAGMFLIESSMTFLRLDFLLTGTRLCAIESSLAHIQASLPAHPDANDTNIKPEASYQRRQRQITSQSANFGFLLAREIQR